MLQEKVGRIIIFFPRQRRTRGGGRLKWKCSAALERKCICWLASPGGGRQSKLKRASHVQDRGPCKRLAA
ncbi:hypothetical protein EMPG_15909 [Blastomyces silverae]|uniref:Uncharacterized protein n=1 Tax=Blastomyces silverae TaxID=2060906 RepID=A0A0H1BHJ4_9EURO|nr:hypothetical protein EMPG_15909 [Blastomyces silverae]